MRVPIMTFAFAVVLAVPGCPGEQETPPENDTSTGGSGDSSGTGDSSGSVDESGTGNACLGADGCWNCEPMESEQLLDQCTEADCEAFPITVERLPLLQPDGSLPPIP